MHRRDFMAAFASWAVFPLTALADEKSEAQARRLIKKLGSKAFGEREEARKALEKIGSPALPALKDAAAHDADPEIRKQASALVKRLTPDPEQEILKRKLGHPPKIRMYLTVWRGRTLTARVGDLIAFQTLLPTHGRKLLLAKTQIQGSAAKEIVTITPEGTEGGVPVKGKTTATTYILASEVGEATLRITSYCAINKTAPGVTANIVFKLRVEK